MANFFSNKFFNKDKIKSKTKLLIIIFGGIIIYILENIYSKNSGIVINKIPMIEKIRKNEIGVYIDGEVNIVGYVKIKEGATLEKVINKAGGITNKADIQNIDFKRVIKSEEKIVIPAKKEEVLEEIVEDKVIDKVNLNLATKEELLRLDGIGEKIADSILEYRQNKRFDSIEEIKEVKGIGESKFDRIKEKICI